MAYMGQGHQPLEAHAPRYRKKGRVLKGKAPPRFLGEDGLVPPLAAPFLGGRGKAAPSPSPLALYIVGGREGSNI